MTIKRNYDGDPVCSDCGHYIDSHTEAMEVDSELVCWDCLRKWAADDFSGFMDFMTAEKRTILYGADIEAIIAEDAAEDEYAGMAEDAAVEASYLGALV